MSQQAFAFACAFNGVDLVPPAVANVVTAGTAVSGSLPGLQGTPQVAIFNQSSADAMVNLGSAGLGAASVGLGLMVPARGYAVVTVDQSATNYSVWMNGTGTVFLYRGEGA